MIEVPDSPMVKEGPPSQAVRVRDRALAFAVIVSFAVSTYYTYGELPTFLRTFIFAGCLVAVLEVAGGGSWRGALSWAKRRPATVALVLLLLAFVMVRGSFASAWHLLLDGLFFASFLFGAFVLLLWVDDRLLRRFRLWNARRK